MRLKTKWHFWFKICYARKKEDIVLVFSNIYMFPGYIVTAGKGADG
jgi:hypothetical protein